MQGVGPEGEGRLKLERIAEIERQPVLASASLFFGSLGKLALRVQVMSRYRPPSGFDMIHAYAGNLEGFAMDSLPHARPPRPKRSW